MNRRPALSLAVGFLLLLGIVVGVASFTVDMRRNADHQADLFRASLLLGQVFSAVQDAETGQRGYFITGDRRYLRPYQDAVSALPDLMKSLDQALAGRIEQQPDFAAFKMLVGQKLAELKHTLDEDAAGHPEAAVALIKSNMGSSIMDDLRATLGRMRARQDDALAAAGAALVSTTNRLLVGVGGAAAVAAFLAWFAFAEKRRQRLLVEGHARALEITNQQLIAEMQSRAAAESQMRQMQKIEAVGHLTGGLAHDFNNMLAVILSALSLMQRRLKAGDKNIHHFVDSATDAANRAATLTQRLLGFARQQPLSPETIDPNKLVSDMSELLRRTLGGTVQLETVLAGGIWRIRADANQLENSIINLAVNARDAMPEGGRITIETSNAHLDEIYVLHNVDAAAGQYVLIAISDTGTGMSPEVAAKAFDPFFTTKGVGKGTGLGLSQVHGFVKQSSGHIKIYSEVGQGTTVKLYLPRYVSTEEPLIITPSKPRSLQAGNSSEAILLVEDEERVRTLSMEALKELGYRVIPADSGKVALALLAQNPDVVVLFTDIVMPEMDGRVLAEEAAKLRPGLKVLYTTGFTRNAVVHNGILDPGVNFLAKPFTLEQLAAKVREVIDR